MILKKDRLLALLILVFLTVTGCATTSVQETGTAQIPPSIPVPEETRTIPAPETGDESPDSAKERYLFVSRVRAALEKDGAVESEQAGQLIALAPDSSYSRFLAGTIFYRNGEIKNARQQFLRSSELDPANEPALSALGEIARKAGDLTLADRYYAKAYEAAATPATANRLALLRIQGGYVESAKEILTATLEDYPLDPMTRNNLAIALDILGSTSEGIDIIDEDDSLDPRLSHTKALLNLKEGRPDKVVQELENGSGTSYSNGRSLLMGIADLQQGKLDSAEDRFRSAITARPLDHEGYMNLGLTLRRQGRFTEAEEVYRKGLEMASHSDLHLNLGVLYELYNGKPALALEQYRKYLEMEGPASDRVKGWVGYLEGVLGAN